jgi:hypothetical protein
MADLGRTRNSPEVMRSFECKARYQVLRVTRSKSQVCVRDAQYQGLSVGHLVAGASDLLDVLSTGY